MTPPFKKAKYHRNVPGGIYVNSPDEEDALGSEWVDRPDLVEEPFKGSPDAIESTAAQLAPKGGDQPSVDPWVGSPKKKAAK